MNDLAINLRRSVADLGIEAELLHNDFEYGMDARKRDQPISVNPYKNGTASALLWSLGWMAMERDLHLAEAEEALCARIMDAMADDDRNGDMFDAIYPSIGGHWPPRYMDAVSYDMSGSMMYCPEYAGDVMDDEHILSDAKGELAHEEQKASPNRLRIRNLKCAIRVIDDSAAYQRELRERARVTEAGQI